MHSSNTSNTEKKYFFDLHARTLVTFILMSLAIMMGFRIFTLFFFGSWDEIIGHRDELSFFLFLGLRYDLKITALAVLFFYWLPVVLVSWWINPEKFRRFIKICFASTLVVFLFLGCVDIGYHTFFSGPIDVLIFGFLEDDTLAVIKTLITDHRLIFLNLSFIALAFGLIATFAYFSSNRNTPHPGLSFKKFALTQIILVVAFGILARGSLNTFPLRSSNASVGDSRFINSLIKNSSQNLQHAFEDHSRSKITKSTREILSEAKASTSLELFKLAGFDSENNLISKTSAKRTTLPHVVFVQMEGWSTEIILGHSQKNQVLGNFARHLKEDHFYKNFFSNAYGTNPTIEALLLNSPITPLSQSVAQKTRFSISNVLPFKKAGYRTLFISGGDSSWRNHEKFWPLQGFDGYIGRAAIERKYNVDASDNPWGVYEEFVFATVKEKLEQAEADGVPLFAYVLTTNNHSPIRLPKNYRRPPLDPSAYGFQPTDEKVLTDLSGFHYQTDQFGRFMTWIKDGKLKDRVVVSATGDHVLKGFTDYSKDERAYLRYSVPAYFYTPPALDRLNDVPKNIAGSHEDIFPTLFELSLSDASYYRFGTPLMEKSPSRAYGWVETKYFIFPEGVSRIDSRSISPWADKSEIQLSSQNRATERWQEQVMGREKYRKLLKAWLLSRDHETQAR